MYKGYILKRLKFSKIIFLKRIILITAVTSILISLLLVSPKEADAITLQELGNAIATLSQDEENLLEKILTSETEVENKRNRLESLNGELEVLENQLDELNKTRIELVKSIKNKKEILEEKIIFSYKYGNDDVKKIIISARDLNEVINNLYLFKNIMRREAEIIEELRLEKEEYDRISRKSEEKMKEIEDTRNKIQDRGTSSC